MRLYGIQATQIFPDGSVLRRTFPELSDNRRIAENLVKRLNNGLVSFDHFEEILEDFIAGDYRAVFPYTAGLSRKSRLIPDEPLLEKNCQILRRKHTLLLR